MEKKIAVAIPADPHPSLEALTDALADLPGPDARAAKAAREREPRLTKPPGSLGRLEDICEFLSAWQGRHPPRMETPSTLVFAGNHGVCAQGVSAYPPEVTGQMVANFEAGGAAVNRLAATFGLALDVVPMRLDRPTGDFTEGPAMTETEFLAAFHRGMSCPRFGSDLLCLGEMGIGNTTSAAAICLALFGGRAVGWTGPGAGVAGRALTNKAAVVEKAVDIHRDRIVDGLRVLRFLGGFELAAVAGAVYGARLGRVPVFLDGFVVTAAAACLNAVNERALDHCLAAHVSAEPGHRKLLDKLGKTALLDLNMRLGEGSGAALAAALARAAVNCHVGMATFEEAGVSEKTD